MFSANASRDESSRQEDQTAGRTSKRLLLFSAVGLLLFAGGALSVWFAVIGSPEPTKTQSPEITGFVAPRQPTLPPLDRNASDMLIEDAARALSPDSEWRRWLAAGDLARRVVAAIATVADGDSPRHPLSALAPGPGFEVVETPSGTRMSAASHARYDLVARVIGSIDVRAAAQVWNLAAPSIRSAWAEISPPGSRVEDALGRAINRLVSVQVPKEPVLLQPRGAIWEFADPSLEAASAAEKHLLRMGPANQRLVQSRLKAFGEALDLPLM